ncbi:MAG: hypothetical protein QOI95_2501 [Acidimicrobiaceae bacterium]|jgi:alpha-beta hydrolase superfamily lysophospholipase
MNGTPFWFGAEDRRLFGWLHEPDGSARGGVVACYPVGYEHLLAYSTFVALADELADAGFVVLRFDYDGTGDSVGNDYEADRVSAWQASIRQSIEFVRALTGEPVSLVGMRLGATLAAAAAAEREDIRAVVLWDPCISGRSFIRESKMLHIVGVGADEHPIDDGAFEAAGHVFTKDTVDALSAVDLTAIPDALAPHVLALIRSDRPFNSKAKAHIDATNDVTWDDALGQSELVDELSLLNNQIPFQAIARIVEWLSSHCPTDAAKAIPRVGRPTTAVIDEVDGRNVIERPVRLGPYGLFGILTELDNDDRRGPTIVCLNYGTAHHIGPSRLWVELARAWAARGLRVLRLDLSGIGDSPARPGQPAQRAYQPDAFDDVVDVLTHLNPADSHDGVLIGVCSGAYLSIDVAALHGVRGVYAINANLRFEPSDLLENSVDAKRAAPPSRSVIRRASASGLGAAIKDRIPPLAWHLLDRLHIHPAPTHVLERIAERGIDTFLGYGIDSDLEMLTRRSKYALRGLERRPNFHLEVVDGMDHLLMLRRHRRQLAETLTTHLVAKYATLPGLPSGASARLSPTNPGGRR